MLYFSYIMTQLIEKIDRTIVNLYYLLFLLTPLVFTSINYELFEYNKMMITYVISVFVGGLFLLRSIIKGRLTIKRTPLDIFLLLFLLSSFLSTVFSIDPHVSVWGYYSRFHQGLLATVSYLVLFYVMVSTVGLKDKTNRFEFVKRVIGISFLSGLLCSFIAVMEHFGRDPLCMLINGKFDVTCWVQDVANRVYATMGQPNWLAAYLLILIFVAAFIFVRKVEENKYLRAAGYGFLTLVYYLALTFTKSKSGFIALVTVAGAGILLGLFIFFKKRSGFGSLFRGFLLILAGFFLISFIFLTPFEKVNKIIRPRKEKVGKEIKKMQKEEKEDLGPINISESADIRKVVWRGAVDIFLAYPLFGSGVETFAYSYYMFKPLEHNKLSEWDFLYNKAHNEYLNFLATTGIIGFATYMLVIVGFGLWAVKRIILRLRKEGVRNERECVALGLFLGWLTILITNFFGFSVVVVALYFYLVPAFLFLIFTKSDKEFVWWFNKEKKEELTVYKWLGLFSVGLLVFYLLFKIYLFWLADTRFSKGSNLAKAQDYLGAYNNLAEAIELNPGEPLYRSEMSYVSAVLSALAYEATETTVSAQFLNQALKESQKAIKSSLYNVPYYKTRTKMFHLLSTINPHYNQEAVMSLEAAFELAPTDAKIAYNLGLLYEAAGDKERTEHFFKKAVELKPDFYDGYFSLANFYWEKGEKQKAIESLEYILKNINAKDKGVIKKLESWGVNYEKSDSL